VRRPKAPRRSSGERAKLVYPQSVPPRNTSRSPSAFPASADGRAGGAREHGARRRATLQHPRWRLSLQTQRLGIR
jgi:hypothetical protein